MAHTLTTLNSTVTAGSRVPAPSPDPMLMPLPLPGRCRLAGSLTLALTVGCAAPRGTVSGGAAAALPAPPVAADSGVTTVLAPGVVQHTLYRSRGPWAIHVLDVDRAACWSPAVLKGDTSAAGRALTSALLRQGGASPDTVAAVNADFFLFAPPGVPTGAHVDDGRVITGPGRRPLVVIDSGGGVSFTTLSVRGAAVGARDSLAITEWNRIPVTQLGAFDQRWGVWTDSAAASLQVVVGRDGRVVRSARGAVPVNIPRGGWVLAAGSSSPAAVRRWLGALRAGDPVRIRTALEPVHPVDAVGGFPLLVRDSALAPVLDSAHVQNLGRARHPRTAVGIGRDGRRLLLVVVDGRQPRYSVGMTLPELGQLMLELGARDALNLDGGGSSTMAVRRASGDVHVVNRPSDATGERTVANALAVVRGCARR